MKTLLSVLLVGLAACASAPVADRPATATVERRLGLMGTELELTVEAANRAAALAASEVAVRALEVAEARLSTWRSDSELALLNRAPAGEPVALSPRLAVELKGVQRWWRETGGAFDPGIGALVAAWGLRSGGRVPTPEEREQARAAGGLAALELTADGRAVRRRAGLRIEEGGWGKGAGLDAAVEALRRDGHATAAMLNLGGQVEVYGQGRWTLAIADPRDRRRAVVALTVASGSVATSGNSEHGFERDGVRYGHLLDPRTGLPARDFGSLTVWAPEALTADCLSKLYVLGPDAALAWARAHAGVEVLALETLPAGLRARATAGWQGKLKALVPELEVEIETRAPGVPASQTGSGEPPSHGQPAAPSQPPVPKGRCCQGGL
ncbi:MAG TPA: FAD:protein FMN transferase [Thermoanaerobaculia bacterium]|nr:FAD:protein FMN transferase [Thermoanaerobaculia bacterium]